MQKIGILGGTFDPIHNGHIAIAKAAIKKVGLETVYLVPAGEPPHKNGTQAGKKHRLQMALLAVAGQPQLCVSEYEICKSGPSYSVDTLHHFRDMFPEQELYFIMGDDAYREIGSWRNAKELFSLCHFLVFKRSGCDIDSRAVRLEIPPIPVSSTLLRQQLQQGKPVSNWIAPAVLDYIQKNHLYGR